MIWFGAVPLMGDPNYATEGMLAMDRWLAAVEADSGTGSLAAKIVRDRPSDVHDRCSQVDGLEQVSVPGLGPVCELKEVQTRFGTPAHRRRRGRRDRHEQVHAEAAAAPRLLPDHVHGRPVAAAQTAFPTGVCDWRRPGVDQADTIPWQTYQDAGGNVVYGGRRSARRPGLGQRLDERRVRLLARGLEKQSPRSVMETADRVPG